MDIELLSKLIPLCAGNKVKSFKQADLEILFHVEQVEEKSQATDQIVQALRKQEEQLPVDLRTDAISSYDAVLNWSGSPEVKSDLPLTGDAPL